MIGSRLLFSGYRSSYKMRPLDAGLLGQDSLLVLDEAHLSQPFAKLVDVIGARGRFQRDGNGRQQGTPLQVIKMSATASEDAGDVFRLNLGRDGQPGDLLDQTIRERFHAAKRLAIRTVAKTDPAEIAREAVTLAQDPLLTGRRIVVFVRSPEIAEGVAKEIRAYGAKRVDEAGDKPKAAKSTPFVQAVEVLTGTMRGLERDELLETPVMKRFLGPDDAAAEPCFLVSTSAGEVGFDLNADHMVCDLSPLDSLIQRLGRVNRRGGEKRAARVLVLAEIPKQKKDKDGEFRPLEPFQMALKATAELLLQCPTDGDGVDVSPRALREFPKPAAALSPKPQTVELTDILLDAWSMTSIVEPMPGRPPVAPWLHGIEKDEPETSIAWREELDLNGFDALDPEDVEEWFDAHRVLTHETLSVPTHIAAKWFVERWSRLGDEQQATGNRPVVIDRGGLRLLKVKDLVAEIDRDKPNLSSILNADLILPASFGGIERHQGLLDALAPAPPKDEHERTPEERKQAVKQRRGAPDVADERGRCRELLTTRDDGELTRRLIGVGIKPVNPAKLIVDIDAGDDQRVQLISYVPKQEKPEWGSKRQALEEHVNSVRQHADEILRRLDIPFVFDRAARLAAEFHDHGKNRERWQRTVGGTATPSGQKWDADTLGKSDGSMRRDPRGYRHEFGSLREFLDCQKDAAITDPHGTDVTSEVLDLAAHLIAAHHGRGRPHFPDGGFDPDAESRSPDVHTDAIRRFARLQRKYGHWQLAWLENLLRCADARASDDNGAQSDADELSGGEA